MTSLPASRHLMWPDCLNTRDLGGLPTGDGRETCRQSLIRSDTLGRLTDAGRQAMLAYGVRTVIDLRSPAEAAEAPSIIADVQDSELAYRNLPLEKYYPHVSALIRQAGSRGEVYCITLDHYPDAVAEVMRAIVDARPGGVVLHCHAGKDRTGIVAALLLRLVDVPVEMVVADYAESQKRLWPLYEKLIEEAGGEEHVDFWLKPTATAEMMAHMLMHLDSQYGGVVPYLHTAGLTAQEIDQLQRRLRTEESRQTHGVG